jgi:hypothetical protein
MARIAPGLTPLAAPAEAPGTGTHARLWGPKSLSLSDPDLDVEAPPPGALPHVYSQGRPLRKQDLRRVPVFLKVSPAAGAAMPVFLKAWPTPLT